MANHCPPCPGLLQPLVQREAASSHTWVPLSLVGVLRRHIYQSMISPLCLIDLCWASLPKNRVNVFPSFGVKPCIIPDVLS